MTGALYKRVNKIDGYLQRDVIARGFVSVLYSFISVRFSVQFLQYVFFCSSAVAASSRNLIL